MTRSAKPRVPSRYLPWDVVVVPFPFSGLPGASVVRASKLATVEEVDLYKRTGTLPPADRQKIAIQLAEFIAR